MVSKKCLAHLRSLATGAVRRPISHDAAKSGSYQPGSRTMATVSDPSMSNLQQSFVTTATSQSRTTPVQPRRRPEGRVTTTVHSFPEMEPLRFAYYPQSHLYLPLRKDILHRAVIYEGDKARFGQASTLWRSEVHGSHKKLAPQKGTGRARVGDKQSPIRRGGGAAFGPKPRDFATGLPKKIYDLAWRTALSFRYRRGQLIIVERMDKLDNYESWWLQKILQENGWGRDNGRSLLVTKQTREQNEGFFTAMERIGRDGLLKDTQDVDVKDLLKTDRVVIEQRALHELLQNHSSDLIAEVDYARLHDVPAVLTKM